MGRTSCRLPLLSTRQNQTTPHHTEVLIERQNELFTMFNMKMVELNRQTEISGIYRKKGNVHIIRRHGNYFYEYNEQLFFIEITLRFIHYILVLYLNIYLKLKKITFFTGCAFLTYFSPESSTTAENSPTAGTQGTLYNDKQSITGVSAHLYKHTYSYIYRLH